MMRGLLAATAALMLLPGAAAARGSMYGELRGGATFLTDSQFEDDTLSAAGFDDVEVSFDTGWLVEGAFGYAHDSGLRGEFALGYRENEADELSGKFLGTPFELDIDGTFSILTTMANLYYDFNLNSYGGSTGAMANLVPFIGGGIGAAFMDIDDDTFDDDDTVFAWQVTAGLAYNFTPNVAGTVSYAYFATSDPEFDGVELDYDSHNVLAGIRYTF